MLERRRRRERERRSDDVRVSSLFSFFFGLKEVLYSVPLDCRIFVVVLVFLNKSPESDRGFWCWEAKRRSIMGPG
jgi:hypothetical protein